MLHSTRFEQNQNGKKRKKDVDNDDGQGKFSDRNRLLRVLHSWILSLEFRHYNRNVMHALIEVLLLLQPEVRES